MMHNSSSRNLADAIGKAVDVLETERRCANRHMFTAAAEVIELKSGARFCTRTTDLGPGGCFVDTTVPFPAGSKVRVTLQKGKTTFQTAGSVVYSQLGLGMGIAFEEHDEPERLALAEWLADITGDRQAIPEIVRMPLPAETEQAPESSAMIRLVRLLVGKGVLTEAEAKTVLRDPGF
jgi:PilZ domain